MVLQETEVRYSNNPVDEDDTGDTHAYIELQQMGFDYRKRYFSRFQGLTMFLSAYHGVHFKRGIVAIVNHSGDYRISFDITAMLKDGRCITITSNPKQDDIEFNNHQVITTTSDVATACQQLLTHLIKFNQPHIPITESNFVQIYQNLYKQRTQYVKHNT